MTHPSQVEGEPSALATPALQSTTAQQSPTPAYPPRVIKVQRAFNQFLSWRAWPWVITLATLWIAGGTAFQWLSKLPASPKCRLVDPTLSAGERLDCADRVARKGDAESLSSSLKLVRNWNPEHPLHLRANMLANQWSRSMLVLARRTMDQGDLEQAVELANQVPKSIDDPQSERDVYDRSQRLIKRWKKKQAQGKKILAKARKEIKRQEWTQAALAVRSLVQLDDEYWQLKADQLLKDMSSEKKAFGNLYKAQTLANSKRPQQMAKAIKIASQIDPKRIAYEKGQEEIAEWSQTLADLAQKSLQDGRFEQAVDAASGIPANTSVAQQASSLVQLGKAEAAAQKNTVWSYLLALALAEPVDSQEVGSDTKQERIQQWEAEIQGASQLQLAQLFANLDHIVAYQVAIDHAEMIALGSPQRDQAQSLIARWNKQIASYQDRQQIARARQFAAAKTKSSYQAAIAAANQIESGQPLYKEAQSLVSEWTDTVETIEDQPILNQARAQAEQGDLQAAVNTARQIKSGRALYKEAQSDLSGWVATIQIAEDRPILNRADSLASQGRLAAAVSQARRIRSGRALYSEARSRINRWQGRLNAIQAEKQRREAARRQQQQQQQSRRQRRQQQRQQRRQRRRRPPAAAPAPAAPGADTAQP